MLHQAVSALTPPAGMRVWLACGRTDMRKYAEPIVMRSWPRAYANPQGAFIIEPGDAPE
jgi:hypothetical protein